jgi:hypothetical protein
MLTGSRYVPPRTFTTSPGFTARAALVIVRNGACCEPLPLSLPAGAT